MNRPIRALLSILIISLLSASEQLRAFAFEDVTSQVFSSIPRLSEASAAWGDFYGNGYWDLAVCGLDASNRPRLYVYRNTGNSLEQLLLPSMNLGFADGDIAWLDYNNNGLLDLLVAGYTSDSRSGEDPKMILYENRGNGQFIISREFPGTYGCSFAIADYNNNGFLDIAVFGRNITPRIYLNLGGEFVMSNLLEGIAPSRSVDGALRSADLTGNGFPDLLQLGLSERDEGNETFTAIYENHGSSFTYRGSVSGFSVYLGDMKISDVFARGYFDMALIGSESFLNLDDTSGSIQVSSDAELSFSSFSITGLYESSIHWGDLTGDGFMELIMSGIDSNKDHRSYILEFDKSTPGNYSKTLLPFDALSDGAVTLVDYNSSGRLDIFLIGADAEGNPTARLLRNNDSSYTNNVPPRVTDMRSRYFNGKLYLMWNDPAPDPSEETPTSGFYYNFRVGSSSGTSDIVPARYGSPLMGNYLTKMTTSTTKDPDILSGSVNVSDYKHLRVMNVSGSGYYWAVQTIDSSLGYSWAVAYGDGWSEQQVFIDETPPTGIPGRPYAESDFTYDRTIQFNFGQGTASDPETGIYGAYVEVTEIDPLGTESIVFEGEISDRLREKVWSDGVGSFEYRGRLYHTYKIRVKARHGYDQQIPTGTYVTSNLLGQWHPDSEHYTEWSEMSGGVTIIELLTLDKNLLKPGDTMSINHALRKSGRVEISIYDRFGNMKNRLLERRVERGNEPEVIWDGTDSSGNKLPGDMYFLNIQVPGGEETRKVVLLR